MQLSQETGRIVLTQLQQRCRSLRIPTEDREDLVQEVAIWIAGHREAGRPITRAWLSSALAKFARSLWRSRRRETSLDDLPPGVEPTRAPRQASRSLAELTRELGQTERRVVELLFDGHTWESALRKAGVPRGSHSQWRTRIREDVAEALGRARTR